MTNYDLSAQLLRTGNALLAPGYAAARVGRGRKRQDENTPRLKVTCHSPRGIQTAAGIANESMLFEP
jgi:hypothetical protein